MYKAADIEHTARVANAIAELATTDEEQGGEVSVSALEAERYHPTENPDSIRPRPS